MDSTSVPAGILPDAEEPQNPQFSDESKWQPKQSKKRLIIIGLIIGVIVGSAGIAACYGYFANRTPETPITSSAKSTSKSQDNSATVGTAPSIESAIISGVKAAYVTLPLTPAQAETDPVNGPGQTITTASGHYLLLDPRGFTYDTKSNEGGKLLYDGRTIYNGPYLFRFALSANGRHYLYVLDTDPKHATGNQQIYVDGKMVQPVSDSEGVYYSQVSDNGKDYAFATGKATGYLSAAELVKDGTTILTAKYGIEVLAFSSDLSKFVAATPSTLSGDQYDVIMNGKTVATNINFMGTAEPSIAISKNGQHYIYTDSKTLFLDGKAVQQIKGVAAMDIADNGSYAVADPLSNAVHVNGSTTNIPNSFAETCNPSCSGSYPVLTLSPDGSHYLFGTLQPAAWSLDGKDATLAGAVENVEFVNGTLYIYRWSDPSLVIKEWGIKITAADADKLTYTIGGTPNGSSANADGIISWAKITLNSSVNTSSKCQQLGYEVDQLTGGTNAIKIGKYSYGFNGTYDSCGDSSADPLRAKITGTELTAGAIAAE